MNRIDRAGGVERPGGFTLVEMIVVMTIIGILLALGLSSFETNDGVPVGVAAEQFESLARTARERSLASGKPVLLAFLIDSTAPESDRRSMHLHVQEEEGWRMATDPEFLPEGVFLDTERSTGLALGVFRPRRDGEEFAFQGIVFRPDQFCEEGGARVVFIAGTRGEGGDIEAKRSRLSAGFLVSRTGHLVRSDPQGSGS